MIFISPALKKNLEDDCSASYFNIFSFLESQKKTAKES